MDLGLAIGVLDLRGGLAVHAVAGDRDRYRPVELAGVPRGDALTLARRYADLGVGGLYVADLDAIVDGSPASWDVLVALSRTVGMPLWVDRGWGKVGDSEASLAGQVERLAGGPSDVIWVMASETLTGTEAFDLGVRAVSQLGGAEGRLAVSVDLLDGVLQSPVDAWRAAGPSAFVERFWELGVRRFVGIDLAAVGTGRTEAARRRFARLIERHPTAYWIAGSGVAGRSDLQDWSNCGCSGVLTATWLQRHLERG